MKTINYAIVGVGYFGAELGRILKTIEGANVVAILDPDNAPAIAAELGCDVEWLPESQTVIATKNSKVMALQIGKNIIILNDIETGKTKVTEIDTTPILYNNRTLIPVRVISECLGYSVDWNNNTQKVIITTANVRV